MPVLVPVDRLPRRESDPYDAAFANPALLHQAGVRLAIVSDSATFSRNLPYEAAMALTGLGALMLIVAFIPFFAFWELGRVIGMRRLAAMFFSKPEAQGEAQRPAS